MSLRQEIYFIIVIADDNDKNRLNQVFVFLRKQAVDGGYDSWGTDEYVGNSFLVLISVLTCSTGVTPYAYLL